MLLSSRENQKGKTKEAPLRVQNVESETTNGLAPEVLLEVPTTEVAFFPKPTYKMCNGIEENSSALYSTT